MDDRRHDPDGDPTLGNLTAESVLFDDSHVERLPRRTLTPPDLGGYMFRGRGSRRASSTRSRHSPRDEDERYSEEQQRELESYERLRQEKRTEARNAEADYNRFMDQRNQAEDERNRAEAAVSCAAD